MSACFHCHVLSSKTNSLLDTFPGSRKWGPIVEDLQLNIGMRAEASALTLETLARASQTDQRTD
jgi:hypothetical protein